MAKKRVVITPPSKSRRPAAAGALRARPTADAVRPTRPRAYTLDRWRQDLADRVGIEDPTWGARPRHVTAEGAQA